MTQLSALLRVDFAYYLAMFTGQTSKKGAKKRSAGRSVLMAILYLYLGVVFVGMFAAMFASIAPAYIEGGLSWLYFTLTYIMALGMMLLGSVFLAKAVLFEAKDNDLLLSMPIPPQKILLARLLPLYFMNLLYGGMVIGTSAVCYFLFGGRLSVMGILFLIFEWLALGLFSLALAALIGWLLAKLGRRFRNQAIPAMIVAVLFFGAYMYFVQNGMTQLMMSLLANGAEIARTLGAFPVLYWIGIAVSDGALFPFLGVFLLCIAIYAAMHYLLTVTFLKTATASGKQKKQAFRIADIRTSSLSGTLLKREHAHLMSSPIYLINASCGTLFMILSAGALIWKRVDIVTTVELFATELSLSANAIGAAAVLLVCACLSMVMFTAPSVSLEGKALWILRSMPLSGKDILRAKLNLHLIWALVPAWLLCIIIAICLHITSVAALCVLFIAPTVFACVSAEIGLWLSLCFANFEWTNEAQPVKQSVAVLLAMFLPLLLTLIPVLLIIVLSLEPFFVISLWTALMLLLAPILYRVLMTWGVRKFEGFDA